MTWQLSSASAITSLSILTDTNMDIIIPLIFISLIIAVGFLIAFIWNIRSGQYSDTYTPSVRILFGDSTQNEKKKSALSPDPVKK